MFERKGPKKFNDSYKPYWFNEPKLNNTKVDPSHGFDASKEINILKEFFRKKLFLQNTSSKISLNGPRGNHVYKKYRERIKKLWKRRNSFHYVHYNPGPILGAFSIYCFFSSFFWLIFELSKFYLYSL